MKLFKGTNEKLSTASLSGKFTVSAPLEAFFLSCFSQSLHSYSQNIWWVLTMVTGPGLIKKQFFWGIGIDLAGSLLAYVLRAV